MNFDEAGRCIKQGEILALRQALDSGLDPNLTNPFSWTLLMLSAIEGNTAIAELLVSRGADVNATNAFGETALALAAHKGHARFARSLLARGASRECRPHGWNLDDWIKQTSGLSSDKIAAILTLLGYREHLH
jgi:ankyrin repeat protein